MEAAENKNPLCFTCLMRHPHSDACAAPTEQVQSVKDCKGGMKLLKFPQKPAAEDKPVEKTAPAVVKVKTDYQEIFENIKAEHTDDVEDVLVMMRNKDGMLHWWGNVGTPPHMLMMIECVKAAIVENESSERDPEPTRA